MRLVTIAEGRSGAAGAVLRDGEILRLATEASDGFAAWIPDSVRGVLDGGPEGLAVVRDAVERVEAASAAERDDLRRLGHVLPSGTRLLAPVPNPRFVLAAGLSYKSHLAEMSGTPPPPHPTAFVKTAASVTGPGDVRLPPSAARRVDYEGEVAVVFGRRCHAVPREDAMNYVAGYTAANDLSARDWVEAVWAAKQPWEARLTWEVNIMGKQFPGFTALGPTLLTADEVPDWRSLELTTTVDGQVVQRSALSDLIHPLEDMIAWFSTWYEFRPGDVLLTGTPAGVGVGRKPPSFLADGSVVEVSLGGAGTLRNVMKSDP